MSGGVELSRGHGDNKVVSIWLTKDQYEQLEQFLDKFSTGESFSDQYREFLLWTINQKEGINTARDFFLVEFSDTR